MSPAGLSWRDLPCDPQRLYQRRGPSRPHSELFCRFGWPWARQTWCSAFRYIQGSVRNTSVEEPRVHANQRQWDGDEKSSNFSIEPRRSLGYKRHQFLAPPQETGVFKSASTTLSRAHTERPIKFDATNQWEGREIFVFIDTLRRAVSYLGTTKRFVVIVRINMKINKEKRGEIYRWLLITVIVFQDLVTMVRKSGWICWTCLRS